MAVTPFTRIVVDKKEEAKFRRRAVSHYPLEHMEALWGKVHADILYIHAFVKVDHTARMKTILYDDTELDEHAEDAAEVGLSYLGTIHTHPDVEDTRFGDTDLEYVQDSEDVVMGICAIQTTEKVDGKSKKLKRKRVKVEYWPTVRPLIAIRHDSPRPRGRKQAIKKGYRLAKKKKSR